MSALRWQLPKPFRARIHGRRLAQRYFACFSPFLFHTDCAQRDRACRVLHVKLLLVLKVTRLPVSVVIARSLSNFRESLGIGYTITQSQRYIKFLSTSFTHPLNFYGSRTLVLLDLRRSKAIRLMCLLYVCRALMVKYRWCCSATPIYNRVEWFAKANSKGGKSSLIYIHLCISNPL